MEIEDATGDARVVPDAMALDADFLDRRGVDPATVGVSVQQIIAWALEHRPDLFASARLAQFSGPDACPQGFKLSTCTSCKGRGVTCEKGTGS
jgi:hypothetical protein